MGPQRFMLPGNECACLLSGNQVRILRPEQLMGGAGAWTQQGDAGGAAKTLPGAERAAGSLAADADGKENSSPRRGPRVRMNLSGGDGRGGGAQTSQLGMGGKGSGGFVFSTCHLPAIILSGSHWRTPQDILLPLSPTQRSIRARLPSPPGKRRRMPSPALAHR